MNKYKKFLIKNGISLSDINPGSDELALNYSEAIIFLKLIHDNNIKLLGLDFLTIENNTLSYLYQSLGIKYIYLNWSKPQKNDLEINDDYIERVYLEAKNIIERAKDICDKYNKKCFVVFVLSDSN